MPIKRIKKIVYTSAPVKGIVAQSKRLYVPGFGEFSLYEIWSPLLLQLHRTNLIERASAISFNIFMAIPPILIFIFTLIPYLPISDRFIAELFAVIRDIIPGEQNHSVIIAFLEDFLERPRNDLLSFGLLLALIFSSNAMLGVLRSFDHNYHSFMRTTTFQKRRKAIKLTLIVFIFCFVSIMLLIAHSTVLEYLGVEIIWVRELIHNIRWLIIILLVFFSVSLIYRHGPKATKRWPYLNPGAVLATVLMVVATFLMTIWVENFSTYNKLYGSIGAIFILMILIYINSMLLLLGFELNVTITSLKIKKVSEQITGKAN
ncbi:MAG TPA: YihY/virulence factor BrkB family protein [Flavisolibacter sp.]|nr:YihY/virulence factor BrkB family protein [Flavisolibacter sp.]